MPDFSEMIPQETPLSKLIKEMPKYEGEVKFVPFENLEKMTPQEVTFLVQHLHVGEN